MGIVMRGILFALAVTCISAPAFGQEILAGGGLIYGSKINSVGLQAHGYYAFAGKLPGLRVGGDIDAFLPRHADAAGGRVTSSWWDINANAQYVFYSPEKLPFNVYGLAGLNFATVGASFQPSPGVASRAVSDHTTEVGVNIGAGAEYTLPFAAAFRDAKYTFSTADQLAITGGLRFAIPLSKAEQQSQQKKTQEDKE